MWWGARRRRKRQRQRPQPPRTRWTRKEMMPCTQRWWLCNIRIPLQSALIIHHFHSYANLPPECQHTQLGVHLQSCVERSQRLLLLLQSFDNLSDHLIIQVLVTRHVNRFVCHRTFQRNFLTNEIIQFGRFNLIYFTWQTLISDFSQSTLLGLIKKLLVAMPFHCHLLF